MSDSKCLAVRQAAAQHRPLQVGAEWVRALAAELDAKDAALAEALDENQTSSAVIDRQGRLLRGVVNAVRGEPGPLAMHSHHDAPELVAGVVDRIAAVERKRNSFEQIATQWKAHADSVVLELTHLRSQLAALTGERVESLTGAFIDAKVKWSRETFGPGARTAGVCNHIRKELAEAEREPTDVTEWADIILLAMDGAVRAGATGDELVRAVIAKDAANRARTWPDWRTLPADAPIEHEKPSAAGVSKAARSVLAERERQRSKEGWTEAHDDEHIYGELADAAACYAVTSEWRGATSPIWPFDRSWWKPTPDDRRRELVKAGALILAEIERLDRAASERREEGKDAV